MTTAYLKAIMEVYGKPITGLGPNGPTYNKILYRCNVLYLLKISTQIVQSGKLQDNFGTPNTCLKLPILLQLFKTSVNNLFVDSHGQ